MNKQKTMQVIRYLSGYYPMTLTKMSSDQVATMVDVWTDALAGEYFDVVERAAKNITKTSKFFPSVSEMFDEIKRVKSMQEAEDWFMANAYKVQGENMKDPEFAAWYRDELFWSRYAAKGKQT